MLSTMSSSRANADESQEFQESQDLSLYTPWSVDGLQGMETVLIVCENAAATAEISLVHARPLLRTLGAWRLRSGDWRLPSGHLLRFASAQALSPRLLKSLRATLVVIYYDEERLARADPGLAWRLRSLLFSLVELGHIRVVHAVDVVKHKATQEGL